MLSSSTTDVPSCSTMSKTVVTVDESKAVEAASSDAGGTNTESPLVPVLRLIMTAAIARMTPNVARAQTVTTNQCRRIKLGGDLCLWFVACLCGFSISDRADVEL